MDIYAIIISTTTLLNGTTIFYVQSDCKRNAIEKFLGLEFSPNGSDCDGRILMEALLNVNDDLFTRSENQKKHRMLNRKLKFGYEKLTYSNEIDEENEIKSFYRSKINDMIEIVMGYNNPENFHCYSVKIEKIKII